jgi:hypothetical protein
MSVSAPTFAQDAAAVWGAVNQPVFDGARTVTVNKAGKN